jgi:protein-L-isoaspartate(D-aspartate) O-methyltransferase
MLELLGAQLGDHVLDVGSGSGWTVALLAYIVGPQGVVLGVDRIAPLVTTARENLARYDMLENATVEEARTGVFGAPDAGPYDRILVSAEIDRLPDELVQQLRIGGVMVIPIKGSLQRVERTGEDLVDVQEYPGFAFVPLIR